MPPRYPALYLADIVEAGRAIERFLAGMSLDDFTGDDLLAGAVHSKLIIIGEAAGVGWPAIVRFRNLVVHAYPVMNLERVHGIATRDVPQLAQAVLAHLRDHHPLIAQAIESGDEPR